tara:strand:+ start:9288 stop:9617 length:330 start_codon:yes stop_codon:yes gene_type:complete
LHHQGGPGGPHDREGLKLENALYHQAFPDLQFVVEDVLAEGDKVSVRFITKGTNTGPLMGMTATGHQMEVQGLGIYQLVDEQITKDWMEFNELGMKQQLGVMSAPKNPD